MMKPKPYAQNDKPVLSPITDIFGEEWVITRRTDSGHGFDLIYGVRAGEERGNLITPTHIIDTALESWILANLHIMPAHWELPITRTRKGLLRRIISSRRYVSLADWEKNRAPDETVFYVHPDYIELPKLEDVDGTPYIPSEIHYYQPSFPIWKGVGEIPAKGKKRPSLQVVLTPQLAQFLAQRQHLDRNGLKALALPLEVSAVIRLRRRAMGHLFPYLQSVQATTARGEDTTATTDSYVHENHNQGANAYDIEGRLWHIRKIRRTQAGDVLLKGVPAGEAHIGNPGHWIMTPELATLFDSHQAYGDNQYLAQRLGIAADTITKMRKRLREGS